MESIDGNPVVLYLTKKMTRRQWEIQFSAFDMSFNHDKKNPLKEVYGTFYMSGFKAH